MENYLIKNDHDDALYALSSLAEAAKEECGFKEIKSVELEYWHALRIRLTPRRITGVMPDGTTRSIRICETWEAGDEPEDGWDENLPAWMWEWETDVLLVISGKLKGIIEEIFSFPVWDDEHLPSADVVIGEAEKMLKALAMVPGSTIEQSFQVYEDDCVNVHCGRVQLTVGGSTLRLAIAGRNIDRVTPELRLETILYDATDDRGGQFAKTFADHGYFGGEEWWCGFKSPLIMYTL